MIIISSFDKIIDVNLNKSKIFIGDIELNNVNEFEIINFKRILFIKKISYLLKYQIKFEFFRKSYILLSKVFIIFRKINRFIN